MKHIDPITLDEDPIDPPRVWIPGRVAAHIHRNYPGLLDAVTAINNRQSPIDNPKRRPHEPTEQNWIE